MKQEIMDCSKDTRTKKTAAIAYKNKWWKQKLGRNCEGSKTKLDLD